MKKILNKCEFKTNNEIFLIRAEEKGKGAIS